VRFCQPFCKSSMVLFVQGIGLRVAYTHSYPWSYLVLSSAPCCGSQGQGHGVVGITRELLGMLCLCVSLPVLLSCGTVAAVLGSWLE
jgi:hypothetical protein